MPEDTNGAKGQNLDEIQDQIGTDGNLDFEKFIKEDQDIGSDFRVLGLIGRGGMGEVYQVERLGD